MIKLKRKRIKGHTYWYAVSQKRVKGKLIDEWQVYLGSAENILKKIKNSGPNFINIRSYEFGKIAAILAINEELSFTAIVDNLTDKKKIEGLSVGEYLLVSIFGRWCGPLSKKATAEKFKHSFLKQFYAIPHKMNPQNILNNIAYVTDGETISRISYELSKQLIDIGLKPTTLLWDTTNFSTCIEHGESIPRKGKAKNKRYDKNLIGVGLAVNDDNIPFSHGTYSGNIHDAKVLRKAVDRIVTHLRSLNIDPHSITLVMDKGNNSEGNIGKILDQMHIVGSLKRDQVDEPMGVPLEEFEFLYTNKKGHVIRGWRTTKKVFGRDFTIIISHNEATEKRQKNTYSRYKKRFLDGMKVLKEKYERPGGRGRKMSQAGAIREVRGLTCDNYQTALCYEVELEPRQLRYWIDEDKEAQLYRSFGKNAIFTDLHGLDSAQIVRIYNSKYQLENDFKLLNDKLIIPLTPVYVRKDDSIRGHVFICITGLLFIRYFFWKMRDLGVSEKMLLEALGGIRVALISTPDMKDVKLVVEEMTPLQSRIFSKLDMGRFIDSN